MKNEEESKFKVTWETPNVADLVTNLKNKHLWMHLSEK